MKTLSKVALSLAAILITPFGLAQTSSRDDLAASAKAGEVVSLSSVAIAKQLANPIANMVSVPLQYNYSGGVGSNKAGASQSLVFQPVVPFSLSGGDAFILRPIFTGVRQTNVDGFTGNGMSNVTIESFWAPNTGSSWIWGVGPYLSFPAGSSGNFGSQQTGLGITGVVLNRDGPWTYGLLGFQSWSVGGNAASGTQNNLYGQPFVAYTNKEAVTFTLEMQAQYNYDARSTSNPLYFGVSKLMVFDKQPVSFSIGPTYYLSSSPGGATGWGGRAQVTFVFPK